MEEKIGKLEKITDYLAKKLIDAKLMTKEEYMGLRTDIVLPSSDTKDSLVTPSKVILEKNKPKEAPLTPTQDKKFYKSEEQKQQVLDYTKNAIDFVTNTENLTYSDLLYGFDDYQTNLQNAIRLPIKLSRKFSNMKKKLIDNQREKGRETPPVKIVTEEDVVHALESYRGIEEILESLQ
jgi:hypothetical protein